MNRLQKSRVTVDFFIHERDVLEVLCEQDIRPPQEQIRWLVLNEAKRRGFSLSLGDDNHSELVTGQGAPACTPEPIFSP